MNEAYICDYIRTPVGKHGGGLSSIRIDDLAAVPIKELMLRNSQVEWDKVDDVIYGCANQAGEDNRDVARMALLLAGMPVEVPGTTVNRLCASGMNAVGIGAQAIKSGESDLIIAGGVESMSRAPWVVPKTEAAFSRNVEIYDTTIGWRLVNKKMEEMYGIDSMPQTAENVAVDYNVSRTDQDNFAYWSQQKADLAQRNGSFAEEIVGVSIAQRKGKPVLMDQDEHLRMTSLDRLGALEPLFPDGSVTVANSSGVNDGAAALLLAGEDAVVKYGLIPKAKILGMVAAGVQPSIMGIGPVPATKKLLNKLGLKMDSIDIIELNEAFAAQAVACCRELEIDANDPRVNPQGGAIALGHPLGMSGARLIMTATHQLVRSNKKLALCTMCVGVGQGLAVVIERV